MRRSARLMVLVVLSVLVVASTSDRHRAAAQPPDERGLEVVQAAYGHLLDLFFRPLEPTALLASGWDALRQAERRAGRAELPPLGELPSERSAAFAEFARAYRDHLVRLPAGTPPAESAFAIVGGMAAGLRERHTQFLSPDVYRRALTTLGGGSSPGGAGVRFAPTAPWTVASVAPDGPAARAGLQPGDIFVTVDGARVVSLTQGQIGDAFFNGTAGRVVMFGVSRAGSGLEIAVTLGPSAFPVLESRLLPEGAGLVRLDQFVFPGVTLAGGADALTELDRRLDELDAAGASGLVLDLRGNFGGAVATAAELLGRFLPEDTPTVIQADGRGHELTGLVSGRMRTTQLPMVVLVDSSSQSASEMTAATLREARRALVVGRRTGGVLSTANILPLPEGAGLQLAVTEVLTARARVKIDGTGLPVDIEAPALTAEDYRLGRDPQLDAAIAALARAPTPPAFASTASSASPARLLELFGRYLPEPGTLPTSARLTTVTRTGTRVLTHPNQSFSFGARDPLARRETMRQRGWLGSVSRGYGAGPGRLPSVTVRITWFATAGGATEALAENDAPEFQETIAPPVRLGEQTAGYRGIWIGQGATSLDWRRGNLVFSIVYSDVPSEPPMDLLTEIAQQVDQAYARSPLTAVTVAALPRTGAAPDPDNSAALAAGFAVAVIIVIGPNLRRRIRLR